MNHQSAVVLDVRDSNEFSQGHIPKALNIPLSAFQSRVNELEKFKEQPIVVACKAGQHSSLAGTILRRAGFEKVAKLRGGLMEWRDNNMPLAKG